MEWVGRGNESGAEESPCPRCHGPAPLGAVPDPRPLRRPHQTQNYEAQAGEAEEEDVGEGDECEGEQAGAVSVPGERVGRGLGRYGGRCFDEDVLEKPLERAPAPQVPHCDPEPRHADGLRIQEKEV